MHDGDGAARLGIEQVTMGEGAVRLDDELLVIPTAVARRCVHAAGMATGCVTCLRTPPRFTTSPSTDSTAQPTWKFE